jgi:hypothetical protein
MAARCTTPRPPPLLALLIRLGAIAALSTMSALIKLASQRGIHLLEIMFWRQALTIPIVLAWVLPTGGIATLATRRPRTHFCGASTARSAWCSISAR